MGLDLSMGVSSNMRNDYYLEPPPEKTIGRVAFVPLLKKAGETPTSIHERLHVNACLEIPKKRLYIPM